MNATPQIEILLPDTIVGSSSAAAVLRVTNTTADELIQLEVEPIVLPGTLSSVGDDANATRTSELEIERNRLVNAVQQQVYSIVEKQRFDNASPSQKAAYLIASLFDGYAVMFSFGRYRPSGMLPSWSREALKIKEWADVEMVEKQFLDGANISPFKRKSFEATKERLRRCLQRIEEGANGRTPANRLLSGHNLSPGDSISFPITFVTSHSLRTRRRDVHLSVAYRTPSDAIVRKTLTKEVTVLSSPFAVPTGALLGAACGYGVRVTLRDATQSAQAIQSFGWWQLGGSILLGLIVALLTARTDKSKKPITVEDFVGGFLIGALVGMFSEEAIKRLAALVR